MTYAQMLAVYIFMMPLAIMAVDGLQNDVEPKDSIAFQNTMVFLWPVTAAICFVVFVYALLNRIIGGKPIA
jgi:hypothetical protein